jgi:hypothetical protein
MVVTTRMKKIGIGIILGFIVIVTWYLVDRFAYARESTLYPNPDIGDTSLTIGIIGDSWVVGHKLDTILFNDLVSYGLNCKVISSGHPGANTKSIYKNLYKKNDREFSSKFIIEEKPDYCIIIAGVNDAANQMGRNFYAHHMTLILKTFLFYNITPVVVSLPEFGIEETIESMNIVSKTRNILVAGINNKGEIDNIEKYRAALENQLRSEKISDNVILIDFDNVCADYNKCSDLYANSSHLSAEGEKILIQIITNELIGEINQF